MRSRPIHVGSIGTDRDREGHRRPRKGPAYQQAPGQHRARASPRFVRSVDDGRHQVDPDAASGRWSCPDGRSPGCGSRHSSSLRRHRRQITWPCSASHRAGVTPPSSTRPGHGAQRDLRWQPHRTDRGARHASARRAHRGEGGRLELAASHGSYRAAVSGARDRPTGSGRPRVPDRHLAGTGQSTDPIQKVLRCRRLATGLLLKPGAPGPREGSRAISTAP